MELIAGFAIGCFAATLVVSVVGWVLFDELKSDKTVNDSLEKVKRESNP